MIEQLQSVDSDSGDSDGDDAESFDSLELTQQREYVMKRAELSSSSSVDDDDSMFNATNVDGGADKQIVPDDQTMIIPMSHLAFKWRQVVITTAIVIIALTMIRTPTPEIIVKKKRPPLPRPRWVIV